jgi:hypothetical protein
LDYLRLLPLGPKEGRRWKLKVVFERVSFVEPNSPFQDAPDHIMVVPYRLYEKLVRLPSGVTKAMFVIFFNPD